MNKLILVSGHSGGGKTTIMRSLMDNEIVSFTTRDKRKGEVDGKDYKYITKEQFHNLKDNDKLIEWVEYSNNFYGIDQQEFDSKIKSGHTFCIVDFHGMQQFKKIYDDCVTIFIYTPVFQAYRQMKERGDSEDKVLTRLKTYEEELSNRGEYDYVVRNNDGQLDLTTDIVRKIIESEVSG